MNVIGFTESGSIRVEIDGMEMFVPDDMGNRHRVMIAEWEAAGNIIPQYAAPQLTPEQRLASLPSVSRAQMLAALVDFEIITEEEAVGWLGGDLPAVVQAAIDGLPEGARLVATLRAKAQTPVDPSDPLVAALAASKDMGPEAIVLLFGHAAGL